MKNFFAILGIILSAFSGATQTWTSIAIIPGAESLKSVSFCDSLFGMVTTNRNKIFVTNDGGYHWTRSYYDSIHPTYELNDIKVFSATHAIAGGSHGVILTFNGTTWTLNPTGTIKNINSIYMYDDSTGYAAGSDGLFIRTNNGGVSWIPLPGFALMDLECVHGFGTEHLKVVYGEGWPKDAAVLHPWFGHVFTSYDGGYTWSEEILPARWIHAVAMVNDSGAFLGGTNYMDQSSLTGYPWILFPSGYSAILYYQGIGIGSIFMISSDEGFAVGASPIVEIKNGGLILYENPTDHWLNDVAAIADTILKKDFSEKRISAWAVGDSGTVLKYTELVVGINENKNNILFSDFLSPNPSSGRYNLLIPHGWYKASISITNLDGKIILSRQFSGKESITIDISAYPDGLYFARLATENGINVRYQNIKLLKLR